MSIYYEYLKKIQEGNNGPILDADPECVRCEGEGLAGEPCPACWQRQDLSNDNYFDPDKEYDESSIRLATKDKKKISKTIYESYLAKVTETYEGASLNINHIKQVSNLIGLEGKHSSMGGGIPGFIFNLSPDEETNEKQVLIFGWYNGPLEYNVLTIPDNNVLESEIMIGDASPAEEANWIKKIMNNFNISLINFDKTSIRPDNLD